MTAAGPTSVIMVSYHTGPVLARSIATVLAQTAPVELILVNNGNPPAVEAELAARSDIRLITGQGNVGFGTACNLGARAATGDYLLFLNPDGLLPPDAIAQMRAKIAALPRPCLLGARMLNADGTDQRGSRRALLTPRTALIEALHLYRLFPQERLNLHEQAIPAAITPVPAISGAFLFLAAADFWLIDGFDEGYFLHVEDLDLCLRFRRKGGEIYFVPDVAVTHLGGTSTATSAFLEKHKARGFRRYFRRNFAASPRWLLWALDAAIIGRLALKLLRRRG